MIAESWKVSDDKLSWTFKIKDIKFSNGNKVTAEAVKKSLERTFAKAPRAKVMFEYESMTDRNWLSRQRSLTQRFRGFWAILFSSLLM